MKKLILATIILFAGLTAVNAQTKSVRKTPALEEASPESVGVSSERLALIDQMCEEAVKEENLPNRKSPSGTCCPIPQGLAMV